MWGSRLLEEPIGIVLRQPRVDILILQIYEHMHSHMFECNVLLSDCCKGWQSNWPSLSECATILK